MTKNEHSDSIYRTNVWKNQASSHKWQTGSLDWFRAMFQWIVIFDEFSEFTYSSSSLKENYMDESPKIGVFLAILRFFIYILQVYIYYFLFIPSSNIQK